MLRPSEEEWDWTASTPRRTLKPSSGAAITAASEMTKDASSLAIRTSGPMADEIGEHLQFTPHGYCIPVENMMCALGVPGNISHGSSSDGVAESPVDAAVAKGMYVT